MNAAIKRRILDATMREIAGAATRETVSLVLDAMARAGVAPEFEAKGRPARLVRKR